MNAKLFFRNSKGKYTEIKGLQPLKETAPRHEFVFVPRLKEVQKMLQKKK